MIRTLKIVTWIALGAGAVATIRFSGVWRDLPRPQGLFGVILTCSPFLLFCSAAAVGRRAVPIVVILGASLFAIYVGISGYYEAFWSDHRSDVNGIVLLVVPVMQAVIGLVALTGAFIDRKNFRRRSDENRSASTKGSERTQARRWRGFV